MIRRTLRHRLEHGLFRAAASSSLLLPEWAALWLGTLLGAVAGTVMRVRRPDVDRHIGWAFPDHSRAWRRRVARACYRHLGREAVVTLRFRRLSAERIRELTRLVGFEAFEASVAAGEGVVLLTGHLGNWEVGGAAIAARNVPLDVVSKGMSNARFEVDLFANRARLGMRVIEMGNAPREALRSLAGGRVVALLGDQSVHSGGVLVDFFGRPALTARGATLFAIRSGAPVYVAFALREPGLSPRYTVRFRPLPFAPSGDVDQDVRALMVAYADALETAIREVPEQYFWQHRRWKNVAAEEPPSDA